MSDWSDETADALAAGCNYLGSVQELLVFAHVGQDEVAQLDCLIKARHHLRTVIGKIELAQFAIRRAQEQRDNP